MFNVSGIEVREINTTKVTPDKATEMNVISKSNSSKKWVRRTVDNTNATSNTLSKSTILPLSLNKSSNGIDNNNINELLNNNKT